MKNLTPNYTLKKTRSMDNRSADEFLRHFEALPGIDARYTDTSLIAAIFKCYQDPVSRVTSFDGARGQGATTTLIEWAKWINEQVLAISLKPGLWNQKGIRAQSWFEPLRVLDPRPGIVLIDSPLGIAEARSSAVSSAFAVYIRAFPYKAFFYDRGAAYGAPARAPGTNLKPATAVTIRDIGTNTLRIPVQVTAARAHEIASQQGRVFTLNGFDWDPETGEGSITLEPGNGVAFLQRGN